MRLQLVRSLLIRILTFLTVIVTPTATQSDVGAGGTSPAVRVVRFRVDYPEADVAAVARTPNWNAIMRKSVLASLRFVNKHWLICGGVVDTLATEKSNVDCGRLQVTGEEVNGAGYRLNATFIANRDPIRNAKVEGATSTVLGVVQIGLRGGIFQYTNAMKALGKPSPRMEYEEAFFCFPGQRLVDGQHCERDPSAAPLTSVSPDAHQHQHRSRKHRRNAQLQRRVAVAAARHNRRHADEAKSPKNE